MNNKKKNQSTSTDLKTKVQTCKRCHMHGDRGVLLADHKLFCKYQSCTCLKCYTFLKQKRYSADVMVLRRAYKLNEKKNIQEVVSPLPLLLANKKCGLHILLNHAYFGLKAAEPTSPSCSNCLKMWCILETLVIYSSLIDERIKFDPFMEDYKNYISRVIHQSMIMNPTPWMPFMTIQQEACCYLPPSMNVTTPDKEQLIGIRSPSQYPLQNLPICPYNSLPIYTDTSSFLENSLKPPTELSSEPFIDPCTEFPESSTEPPTESCK